MYNKEQMKLYFELYVVDDDLSADKWKKLYGSLVSYLGILGRFEIVFQCKDNIVRYFIGSDRDVSSLSNGLEGMLLRPVNEEEVQLPRALSKERMLQFVTGGNILDLKEKVAVKRAKQLEWAVFRVRIVNIEKAYIRSKLLFKGASNQWSQQNKMLTMFPTQLLAINFGENPRYLRKTIPKYLNIEKSLHMMNGQDEDALFEVNTFPYTSHNYYLGLTDYEFDKHSFIIGASGSGKSKFISLFVDRLARTQLKMNYRVVVIDPHASLAEDFSHIQDSRVISFGKDDNADLFPGAGTDLTSATELTATLFKSVLGDQFNPRLDKLLRFSLFVLMTAQAMSLENLRRFLMEIEYRNKILDHVDSYVPNNVIKFFGTEYNELRTQFYNQTVMPLVAMVDEMQLQPSLVGESEVSLARTIQENFLTVFSLNKVSMGEKVVKTIAGLLIQQIFLLAQSRAFNQRVLLVIDEVSVVQNPALAQILAEARKFNLTVILTQQYFGQVEKDLRDAIFANVMNYYAFKVSEEDAIGLEGNLNIELPKEIVESEHEKGVKEAEVKVKIMTELHPRECLVRVMSNGQVAPCFKARTMDAPEPKKYHAEDLKPVQKLPEKFTESDGVVEHEGVHFSEEFQRMLSSKAVEEPEGAKNLGTSYGYSGMHDLLASSSASREQVTKKENKE